MQRQRSVQGLKIVETEYAGLQKEMQGIIDSLVSLGALGVNDVEYQSQVLNQQFAIALMNGNTRAVMHFRKNWMSWVNTAGSICR